MTWVLTATEIRKHGNPQLARLLRDVSFTFENIDANGAAIETHTYREQNVSDVSPLGLARLARDQMAQLERIAATEPGKLSDDDLASLRVLVAGPVHPSHVVDAIVNALDLANTTLSNEEAAQALNVEDHPNPAESAPDDPERKSHVSRASLILGRNATPADIAFSRALT